MRSIVPLFLLLAVSNNVLADAYSVYIPNGNSQNNLIKIVNLTANTVVSFSGSDYLETQQSSYYDFGDNSYANVFPNGNNSQYQQVVDIKGNQLILRENTAIEVGDKGADGIANTQDDTAGMYFDRELTIDMTTGEVVSERLVANSEEAKAYADNANVTAELMEIEDIQAHDALTAKTYSENLSNDENSGAVVVTQGSFSTAKITDEDGSSLFRQETDGTVHIGENSIVLADENVSNSGYDQIYSSSNVLELGNSATHRTVITGTLEIQDPTAPNHAATKRYVDGATASVAAISALPRITESGLTIGLGIGEQSGQTAIAIGGGAYKPELGLSFTFAAAYNSTLKSTTNSVGVGWNFK
jgi:hypothetical protein